MHEVQFQSVEENLPEKRNKRELVHKLWSGKRNRSVCGWRVRSKNRVQPNSEPMF